MTPKTANPKSPRVRPRTNGKPKRAYSYSYPSRGAVASFYLSAAPIDLMTRAKARAAREDISMRTLILSLLEDWLGQETTPTHK